MARNLTEIYELGSDGVVYEEDGNVVMSPRIQKEVREAFKRKGEHKRLENTRSSKKHRSSSNESNMKTPAKTY